MFWNRKAEKRIADLQKEVDRLLVARQVAANSASTASAERDRAIAERGAVEQRVRDRDATIAGLEEQIAQLQQEAVTAAQTSVSRFRELQQWTADSHRALLKLVGVEADPAVLDPVATLKVKIGALIEQRDKLLETEKNLTTMIADLHGAATVHLHGQSLPEGVTVQEYARRLLQDASIDQNRSTEPGDEESILRSIFQDVLTVSGFDDCVSTDESDRRRMVEFFGNMRGRANCYDMIAEDLGKGGTVPERTQAVFAVRDLINFMKAVCEKLNVSRREDACEKIVWLLSERERKAMATADAEDDAEWDRVKANGGSLMTGCGSIRNAFDQDAAMKEITALRAALVEKCRDFEVLFAECSVLREVLQPVRTTFRDAGREWIAVQIPRAIAIQQEIDEIMSELDRQKAKGYTLEHDANHQRGELAECAALILVESAAAWGDGSFWTVAAARHAHGKYGWRDRLKIAAALLVAEMRRVRGDEEKSKPVPNGFFRSLSVVPADIFRVALLEILERHRGGGIIESVQEQSLRLLESNPGTDQEIVERIARLRAWR